MIAFTIVRCEYFLVHIKNYLAPVGLLVLFYLLYFFIGEGVFTFGSSCAKN